MVSGDLSGGYVLGFGRKKAVIHDCQQLARQATTTWRMGHARKGPLAASVWCVVNVGYQALIAAATRTEMSETCQPRRQANCAFPCQNPFPRQARLPVAGENAVITLM